MSDPYAPALSASHALLVILRVLILGLLAILIASLPATFLFEPLLRDYYSSRPPLNAGQIIPPLRFAIVLGLPMLAAVHVLLTRLLAIVETVRTGDPFVPQNADRMKTIAWCLLAIQLMGMGFSAMAERLRAGGAHVDSWDFSLTGWVAVVLLFVLARVFEEGTRIRSDLEAMI